MSDGSEKILVMLNGKSVQAENEERLIEIIKRNGIFLSAPCYHEFLSETGHCGMCLVGARRRKEDKFTVVFACTATAKDGMEIDTEYPEAVASRYDSFIMCLAQHPLDCSKCDKVGNCFLHKFSSQTKFRGFTRVVNGKLDGVEYKHFGEKVLFDGQKCVFCKRCIRFCRDVLGEELLGPILNEKGYKEINLYPGKTLNSNYSLNLVDLCPAGAFINENCIYQPAEWDLIHTPSISTESSVGVNTYVLHKNDKIFRIVPRENKYVNWSWMPDSARVEHKCFESKKRLKKILRNGVQSHLENVVSYIVQAVSACEISVVCSGNMSLEDQFVLQVFLGAVVSDMYFLEKKRVTDGFLVSSDGSPNFNGAILTKLANENAVVQDLKALNKKIQNGQCKKILSINEDIFSNGVSYSIPDDVEIFYIGTDYNKTSSRATVSIPVATVFENTGTFINRDWRLQKFHKAVNPPNSSILPMWYIFSLLLNVYFHAAENDLYWLEDVWHAINKSVDLLEKIDFANLDSDGVLLKKC